MGWGLVLNPYFDTCYATFVKDAFRKRNYASQSNTQELSFIGAPCMYVEREVDGSRNCPWNITLFRGRWLLASFTVLSSAVVRPLPLSRDSLLLPAVHFLRNGFRRIRASAATLCCFSQPKHSRSTQQTGWHFRRRTTCRSPCPHGTTLLMLSAEFILALRPRGSLRYCTSHPILPLSS